MNARPDAEHDAVLACQERHQVVVAPPGTGKTYASVRLAGTLADELAPHARVLLLTFSRQARGQLEREAARQLKPVLRARVEVTNYHRLCWQAVQAYRRVLDLPDVLDIGSSRRRTAALKTASADGWNAIKDHSGLADSLAEHAFEAFRDRRTPPPELLQALLAAVEVEQREGRLVFDDFGALFWRLLQTQPTVARAYAARYPAVIADEHQDASALQDAIVRRFGVTRLVVLADDMQLIHGFRGTDERTLAAQLDEPTAAAHDAQQAHEDPTPATGVGDLSAERLQFGKAFRALLAELSVEKPQRKTGQPPGLSRSAASPRRTTAPAHLNRLCRRQSQIATVTPGAERGVRGQPMHPWSGPLAPRMHRHR